MITQRWSFFDLSLALLFRHKIFKATVHVLFPFFEKRKRILHYNFHIQKAELHKHSKTIHQFVFIENHIALTFLVKKMNELPHRS